MFKMTKKKDCNGFMYNILELLWKVVSMTPRPFFEYGHFHAVATFFYTNQWKPYLVYHGKMWWMVWQIVTETRPTLTCKTSPQFSYFSTVQMAQQQSFQKIVEH